MKRKQWTGRVYLGRDESGKQIIHWVGRFDTKRERDEAVARARALLKGGRTDLPTCDAYVDRYLTIYERANKDSSYDTQRQRLVKFKKDFAGRRLDIPRQEARDWASGEGVWAGTGAKTSAIPAIISLYNFAIDEDDLPLERNPFRKLAKTSKGRAEQPPPTEEEFDALLDACTVLKDYAPMMRAMFKFAAFELMRPSELYGLEWADIDFEAMRINKARRVYRGKVDSPKTGKKLIPLTPPARDAIMVLPREGNLVFRSKTGKRLSAGAMSTYWPVVLAKADLDFDFYHATKHYGVWFMWTKMRMSERAIAAIAGWSLKTVHKMLEVYGHADVGALEEVDRAFENNVVELREVAGREQS